MAAAVRPDIPPCRKCRGCYGDGYTQVIATSGKFRGGYMKVKCSQCNGSGRSSVERTSR